MFFHLFKYRIKSLLRSKVIVFWCLGFPIILGILFYAGFGSTIGEDPSFEPIPLGVVTAKDSPENKVFLDIVKDVSYNDGSRMFDVTFTDESEAKALLEDKKVTGVITVSDDISLTVASEGIDQSIIKQFCDSYLRQKHVIEDIAMAGGDPAKAMDALSKESSVIRQVSLGGEKADPSTQYFYALVAYACLFGSFTGLAIGNDVQVKDSPKGARKSVSSVHRLKMIVSDMLAGFLIDFIEVVIVVLFINYVLGIGILSGSLLFLPVCMFGTMIGVCWGQFVSCIAGGREGLKIALSLLFSLLSSFFAGLMFGDMKYLIDKHLPILGRINPASLISDAFYSLSVYSDYSRYISDIVILAIEAAVLVTGSFLAVRRSNHDSI